MNVMKNIEFIRRSRLSSLATAAKTILIVSLLALSSELKAQTFTLADDNAITGPYQKVRIHVVYNDLIPCSDYTLSIIPPSSTGQNPGTATVAAGGFIEYTPGKDDILSIINDTTEVSIIYKVECGSMQRTATLRVRVTKFNNPSNVIPADVECYVHMPQNINFDTPNVLFETTRVSEHCVDGATSPMVGDLDGDGKPEIVMVGVSGTFGADSSVRTIRYINVYSGQTGAELIHFSLPSEDQLQMGSMYHRAPSQLALVDVDNNGKGEIIIALANGKVICYSPNLNDAGRIIPVGASGSGLNKKWQADVNYNVPATVGQHRFGVPHPQIADINGDGIPEVIVYNKIYNAKNGKLLMAWGNAGANMPSVTSGTSGLRALNYATPSGETQAQDLRNSALTGRRPGGGTATDADLNTRLNSWLAVPAIVDIDGDGTQEIITGIRIHKFNITNLDGQGGNTYSTIEAPSYSVTVKEKNSETYYLSDGMTRVADIDGDGKLDIVVTTVVSTKFQDNVTKVDDVKILLYVWSYDPANNSKEIKAALTYTSHGIFGTLGIPFIGDIDGIKDGRKIGGTFTKKLPEICIISGMVDIRQGSTNATSTVNAASGSGISFHDLVPLYSNLRGAVTGFNLNPTAADADDDTQGAKYQGHIICLTYDDSHANIQDRLRMSWGIGHKDGSNNTGITLFDFDNNGTADLCYRDESWLRIISPAKVTAKTGNVADRYIL